MCKQYQIEVHVLPLLSSPLPSSLPSTICEPQLRSSSTPANTPASSKHPTATSPNPVRLPSPPPLSPSFSFHPIPSPQPAAKPSLSSLASLLHGITLHPQHAPHKCPPCRTYDRDRWRRGWPPIPLPPPPTPRYSAPRVRKIPDEPGSDEDDFAVVFEEGTMMMMDKRRVEHDEESGGVGLGVGLGLGGIGEGVVMSGGLNGGDTGSSEGFGLGIDGAGGREDAKITTTTSTSTTETTTPTTPTKKSTTQDLINKMRAQSFAEGVESGIRGELRSRFGGFGGRKLRDRRVSTVEMGGVPMERTVSNRGSLALQSPRRSSYRGADMERGGGLGLGIGIGTGSGAVDTNVDSGFEKQKESEGGELGLGLGLGFGGVPMERDGGMAKVDSGDAKTWLRKTRRESIFSKSAPAITWEVDGTREDDMESVTARFLDF
ncbi:hypothetical protein DL98DRAFT_535938 [Cadophora sp. DSE1049]|nr:hypothetical protein DL98DRAFT_535938 [Cadophora sp. DSE1049]